MKGYVEKDLVIELLQFLRSSNRKAILLKDYIRITDSRFHWTKRRVQVLHKAIHATKAISVDYVSMQVPTKKIGSEGRETIQCIRVKRTETIHQQPTETPREKEKSNPCKREYGVYRIIWRKEWLLEKVRKLRMEKRAKMT